MVESRSAFITGISGQDGSYLAEILLSKQYEVHGLVETRRKDRLDNLKAIEGDINLIPGNLAASKPLFDIIQAIKPDEIYNLGAISSVRECWQDPIKVSQVNGIGVVRVLQAVRKHSPNSRMFQASTSEIFGKAVVSPQNENTAFNPRNPYGISKLLAHLNVVQFREKYTLHVSNGILYNHESPRRGTKFVTRKISSGVASIKLGLSDRIVLGDLDARRDWGYAPEYVKAMWLMLQQERPDDYIISTGRTNSVRDFLKMAFTYADIPDWKDHIRVDEAYLRPKEEVEMRGDGSKASRSLGWKPEVPFDELVKLMVDHDMDLLKKGP